MAQINLTTPFFDGAIQGVSFFNGRLLSGEDLTAEQSATRQGRRLLGKALGDGIVYGLEVSKAASGGASVVTIQPGLAINREGRTLQLEKAVDVSLNYSDTAQIVSFNGFMKCIDGATTFSKPTKSSFTPVANRVYLLVIAPADVGIGRAPVSGLGTIDTGCNSRYSVEGVQFRMIPLGLLETDYDDLHKLRNRIAARCIQTPDVGIDPFGAIAQPQGLLDTLRTLPDEDKCLKNCEVPLAAVYMETAGSVRFVDVWSVRRRVTSPSPSERWSALFGDRSLAEGEARFLQFEAHVNDLVQLQSQEDFSSPLSDDPSQITAFTRFDWLPPVGILPINNANLPSGFSLGSSVPGGFNWQTFFGVQAPLRLDLTDSTMLARLLHDSFFHQPIQVGDQSDSTLRLYLIRENYRAFSQTTPPGYLALVFAKRTLPYAGVARFGSANWDVGHYA